MITKVWYLPYFEGVYHTRIVESFANANARLFHTMLSFIRLDFFSLFSLFFLVLHHVASSNPAFLSFLLHF